MPCDCQSTKNIGFLEHLQVFETLTMQHIMLNTEPKICLGRVIYKQSFRCKMKSMHLYLSVSDCQQDEVGMQARSQTESGLNLKALNWCPGVSLTIPY